MKAAYLAVLVTMLFFMFGFRADDPELEGAKARAQSNTLVHTPKPSNVDDLLDFEEVDLEVEKEKRIKEEERIKEIHEIFKSRTVEDLLFDEMTERVEIA